MRVGAIMSVFLSFLLTFRTAACSGAAIQLEILALRHQLEVLQRTRPPLFRLAKTDRWVWVYSRASGPTGERRSFSSSLRPSLCGHGGASGCGGLASTAQDDQLLPEQEILHDYRSHATRATQLRGHDGQVEQGDRHQRRHPREPLPRGLNDLRRCFAALDTIRSTSVVGMSNSRFAR